MVSVDIKEVEQLLKLLIEIFWGKSGEWKIDLYNWKSEIGIVLNYWKKNNTVFGEIQWKTVILVFYFLNNFFDSKNSYKLIKIFCRTITELFKERKMQTVVVPWF